MVERRFSLGRQKTTFSPRFSFPENGLAPLFEKARASRKRREGDREAEPAVRIDEKPRERKEKAVRRANGNRRLRKEADRVKKERNHYKERAEKAEKALEEKEDDPGSPAGFFRRESVFPFVPTSSSPFSGSRSPSARANVEGRFESVAGSGNRTKKEEIPCVSDTCESDRVPAKTHGDRTGSPPFGGAREPAATA